MARLMLSLVLSLVAFVFVTVNASNPCWTDDHPCSVLLTLTNGLRTTTGLSTLTCDTRLRDASQEHSDDMVQNNYFSHQGSDGSTYYDRIRAQGYNYRVASENIAAGSAKPVDALNSWRGTAGFLRISDPGYTQFGCGFSTGGRFGYAWTVLMAAPAWSPFQLSQDATFQYAIVAYDLERTAAAFNYTDLGRCIRTQFIRDMSDPTNSNTGRVVFMGKDINLHLKQVFCGHPANQDFWEGAGPYCPGEPANRVLPIDLKFTGDADADLASNIFVQWRNRDLTEWGARLAQCDMTMYSAYLLLHGEGLQHAVLRPGTGATVDNLLNFLKTNKRCLVQALTGIDNPEFPALKDIFFFSLYDCPGDTYEERLRHPNFPYTVGTVVEVVVSKTMPKREEFAEYMREEYGIELDVQPTALVDSGRS